MAKILLANQWGGGVGHVNKLHPIALAMQQRGHEVTLALPDLPAARAVVAGASYRLLQAPVWRGNLLPRKTTRSFADIMANQAFADVGTLSILADAWWQLLQLLQPDLVIADYAPVLCLAARDRFPLAVVGTTFCVPPAHLQQFPVLLSQAEVGYPESESLANANTWLLANKREPLAFLPAIHPAEACFPLGLPELDPYREHRVGRDSAELAWHLLSPLEPQPVADKLRVFAYLSGRHRQSLALLAHLAHGGARVKVYLRDSRPELLPGLRRFGIEVLDKPAPIARALAGCDLILHHGSGHISLEALSGGRPQVCIPMDVEKRLSAKRLEQLGVGLVLSAEQLPQGAPSGGANPFLRKLEDFVRDAAVQARVAEMAAELEARHYPDPLPIMVEEMERLL
jgi:UDP:flavonoid glycosyltransferase YjiC (YdhE family)